MTADAQFLTEFLKSTSNFEHLETIESHNLRISEIIDCERRDYLSKKLCFRALFKWSTC